MATTSIATKIAPHLPYLRRFARALCGSQESGDAYVTTTLEALIEDPGSFPEKMHAKAGLFHIFLKLWNSVDLNGKATPGPVPKGMAAVDRNIEKLTPVSRQAFLLTALEDFDPQVAAAILNIEAGEFNALTAQASHEIAQQVATTVLIIEDEPLIAMDLEDIVTSIDHSVVGVARTHKEAVELVRNGTRPGLILADIQLADGSSGIDAVNELLKSLEVPVIFITAFPERLLTGERPEPTFLITKPFQPAMIKAIVSQSLFFDRRAHLAA